MKISQKEFYKILQFYRRELSEPSYFEKVQTFYSSRSEVEVTAEGNPLPQVIRDYKKTNNEEFKEFIEDVKRTSALVLVSLKQLEEKKFKPSDFASVSRRILSAKKTDLEIPLSISLENGIEGSLDLKTRELLGQWAAEYKKEYNKYLQKARETGVKGYKELSLFTFAGFGGGIISGAALDWLGFSASAVGEWAVRTLSGESETLAEGLWAIKSKYSQESENDEREDNLKEEGLVWFEKEAAEAYGLGKLAGMAVPWIAHAFYIFTGLDVRGPEGSLVAYLYSLADQVGASVNGLRVKISKAGIFGGLRNYFSDPVMVASFVIITLPLLLVYMVRSAGFRPDFLTLAAIEGALLNLCWVPPAVAWLWDWRLQRNLRALGNDFVRRAQ